MNRLALSHLVWGVGLFALTTGLFALTTTANAHMSFVDVKAYAGNQYIAVMNISHGCSDDAGNHYDTVGVEINIPANFTAVRPMDSTFGPATIEKDTNGQVTQLTWQKSLAALPEDSHFYQVTFRGKLPNTPLKTLTFSAKQICAEGKTTAWEGLDAPTLQVLPVHAAGWNKYTAQTNIDEATLKSFFKGAEIVWSNGAAFSANPVTQGLVTQKLTGIVQGAEYWVKY